MKILPLKIKDVYCILYKIYFCVLKQLSETAEIAVKWTVLLSNFGVDWVLFVSVAFKVTPHFLAAHSPLERGEVLEYWSIEVLERDPLHALSRTAKCPTIYPCHTRCLAQIVDYTVFMTWVLSWISKATLFFNSFGQKDQSILCSLPKIKPRSILAAPVMLKF